MNEIEDRVKKPTPGFNVISAKAPKELFAAIEHFRNENNLNSRNDAILLLIALGFYSLGEISEETVKRYAARYHFTFESEGVR